MVSGSAHGHSVRLHHLFPWQPAGGALEPEVVAGSKAWESALCGGGYSFGGLLNRKWNCRADGAQSHPRKASDLSGQARIQFWPWSAAGGEWAKVEKWKRRRVASFSHLDSSEFFLGTR